MASLLPGLDEIPHLLEEISDIMMNLDADTIVVPNEKLEKEFHKFRSTFRDNIIQYLQTALPTCNDFYQAIALLFEKFEDLDYETWRKNVAEIRSTVKMCKQISCQLIRIHEDIDEPLNQRKNEIRSLKQMCSEMLLQSEKKVQGKDSLSGGFGITSFRPFGLFNKAGKVNKETFRHEDLLECQNAIHSFENEVFPKILTFHQNVLEVAAAAKDITEKLTEFQNGSDFVEQKTVENNSDKEKSGNEGKKPPQEMSETKDGGLKHLADVNVQYDSKGYFNRVQEHTYYASSSFLKFRSIFPVVKSNMDAILASKSKEDTEIL